MYIQKYHEQADCVSGCGIREQILNLRKIIEKQREFNKTLYLCFVDLGQI